MTGYMHPGYAASLAEFGTPQELPLSGGWILKRQIPGSNDYDGMGCYPLFNCKNWSLLPKDIEDIGKSLVSLSIVTDPFGNYDLPILQSCFKDLLIPFKDHFVIKLGNSLKTFVSEHHQRNARKACQIIKVEQCENLELLIDEWVLLYSNLVQKHQIKGISAFSKSSFLKQFQVPGIIGFRAIHEGATVGMILWYISQQVGYYHLGAYSDVGYQLGVSFALFWSSISWLTDFGLAWLNLGAGAGVVRNSSEGLSRFKRGWATGTRTTYFCGRIFDAKIYSELTANKQAVMGSYFPDYRKGEFR